MQNVQHLALVLVQTLDLDVKQGVGIDLDAVGLGDVVGKAHLVVVLDAGKLGQDSGVVLVFEQLFQVVCVLEEAVADQLAQKVGQLGVGLAKPAAVGDAVGDVDKPLGRDLVVVVEDAFLEDVGVELGHAVDHMAGGKAEVCHADLAVCNDGHPVELALVVAVVGAQLLHQAAVDLLGDGVDAGHLLFVELYAPALEGLAHHGVVGVRQGAAGDVPGLVPAVVVLVEQKAHQFGHAQGRMGVVDVDGDLVGQIVQGAVLFLMLAQDSLQGSRAQQVLLLQAQPLALDVVVCRVQDLGDGLSHGVLLQRADVVASGEGGHVEALGELGAPEHELVDRLGAVAGNIKVVGHGHHSGVAMLGDLELAVVIPFVDLAAKADLNGVVLLGDQPHVAHLQPVVGQLHLPAVYDLLLEDAKLIPDGEARCGVVQAGEAVHIAGGQTTQAAVAQARIGVELVQGGDILAQILERLGKGLFQAHVVEVVAQACANQELHRHIVDLLASFFFIALFKGAAAVVHLVAQHRAQGLIGLLVGCLVHIAAKQAHTGLVQALDCLLFVHVPSEIYIKISAKHSFGTGFGSTERYYSTDNRIFQDKIWNLRVKYGFYRSKHQISIRNLEVFEVSLAVEFKRARHGDIAALGGIVGGVAVLALPGELNALRAAAKRVFNQTRVVVAVHALGHDKVARHADGLALVCLGLGDDVKDLGIDHGAVHFGEINVKPVGGGNLRQRIGRGGPGRLGGRLTGLIEHVLHGLALVDHNRPLDLLRAAAQKQQRQHAGKDPKLQSDCPL